MDIIGNVPPTHKTRTSPKHILAYHNMKLKREIDFSPWPCRWCESLRIYTQMDLYVALLSSSCHCCCCCCGGRCWWFCRSGCCLSSNSSRCCYGTALYYWPNRLYCWMVINSHYALWKIRKKNEEEEQIEWWTCWRTFVSVSQKEHNKINIIIMHTKLPLHYITLIWLNYRKTIDLTRAVRHRTRLITVTYCMHKKLNANRNDDTHKGRLTCPQMSLSQIEFVDWWSYWILVFNGILGMANESASTV